MDEYLELEIYATYKDHNTGELSEELAGEISITPDNMPQSFEIDGVNYIAQF